MYAHLMPLETRRCSIWQPISHTYITTKYYLVGWLEFNIPFQHKYGYIRDERSGVKEG